MRLSRTLDPAEWRRAASDSATQSLWLRHGKVRSQAFVITDADCLKKEQLKKFEEEEETEAEPTTDQTIELTDLDQILGKSKRSKLSKERTLTRICSAFWVPKVVMTIKVPLREEIYGEKETKGRKGVGSIIPRRRVQVFKKEREFSNEILTST